MSKLRTTGVILLVALVVSATSGIGLVAAGPGNAPDKAAGKGGHGTVVSAHGHDVYVVFGANPEAGDLASWVEAHKQEIQSTGGTSSTRVLQYQDVTQLNINSQTNATAISIDGGEATAIQSSDQRNVNAQFGRAEATSATPSKGGTSVEDVGTVYIVFAGGTQVYSGWVLDMPGKSKSHGPPRHATASVNQRQDADQLNTNNQTLAMAVAENGSYAEAVQINNQSNQNLQSADASASVPGAGNANASLVQRQTITQRNVNEQGTAVAIAVGQGSVAIARQVSTQWNLNQQIANVTATSFAIPSFQEFVATADIPGQGADVAVHTRADGGAPEMNATANVTQVQDVSQNNSNAQVAAIAYARNGSEAVAYQNTYQANMNAQFADASAAFTPGKSQRWAVIADTTVSGDDAWATLGSVSTDQANDLRTPAVVSQVQFVSQLNIAEKEGTIAVADRGENATAQQITYQVNENVQAATVGP